MNFFKKTTNNNNNVVNAECAVDDVRETLFKKIDTSKFNKKDLERLKKNDYAISRYYKKDTESTVEAIKSVLEWRNSLSLSDLKDEDFPEEYHKSEVFVVDGHDCDGHKMVYIRVKLFKKGEQPIDDVKKYLAFLMDRIDRETIGEGWALCFDCTGAGLSNVDIDLLRFIVAALNTYFVENCKYVLVYEMPWILSPIWKIVKSWLPQEERDAVKFASKKDFNKFVKSDEVPSFMKEE